MKPILALLLPLFVLSVSNPSETAYDVVKKMDENARGQSSKQEIKVEVIRPNWTKEMTIKAWSKGTRYGMMLIKEPIRDRGVSYLKIGYEAWNWQPSIERSIKLPPSTLMQAWHGSDVSNDDMIKVSSEVVHYTHKFLEDTVIEGHATYSIELTPKDDAPVVWGKVHLYVTKEHYVKTLARYYDEYGELIRDVFYHDIKMMGGRWHPSWQEVVPANKEGHKTISRVIAVEFDFPIEESFFSIQNLKRMEHIH